MFIVFRIHINLTRMYVSVTFAKNFYAQHNKICYFISWTIFCCENNERIDQQQYQKQPTRDDDHYQPNEPYTSAHINKEKLLLKNAKNRVFYNAIFISHNENAI